MGFQKGTTVAAYFYAKALARKTINPELNPQYVKRTC